MKNFRFVLVMAGVCTLASIGCQHSYQEVKLADQAAPPRLRTDANAYIAIPPDALHKKDLALGSGQMTALAVRDAFGKYLRRAYLGRRMETYPEGLETARISRCTYFVYPSIIRWEDHATEFSGVRDKLEIKIQIADPATGELLHAVILKGKSRWMTDGGDTPQNLLDEPVRSYVASLFQVVHVPSALR